MKIEGGQVADRGEEGLRAAEVSPGSSGLEILVFNKELPITPAGKVLRRAIVASLNV